MTLFMFIEDALPNCSLRNGLVRVNFSSEAVPSSGSEPAFFHSQQDQAILIVQQIDLDSSIQFYNFSASLKLILLISIVCDCNNESPPICFFTTTSLIKGLCVRLTNKNYRI